ALRVTPAGSALQPRRKGRKPGDRDLRCLESRGSRESLFFCCRRPKSARARHWLPRRPCLRCSARNPRARRAAGRAQSPCGSWRREEPRRRSVSVASTRGEPGQHFLEGVRTFGATHAFLEPSLLCIPIPIEPVVEPTRQDLDL